MSNIQSERKSIFVDYTRCTGCRACQVACKEWHADRDQNKSRAGSLSLWAKRAEERDVQFGGSLDISPALSPRNLSLIRFFEPYNEVSELHGGEVEWRFQRVSCMHCWEAACEMVCPVRGCISYDVRSGHMVVLEPELCVGCMYCVSACPFGVPQFDPATKKVYKCNGCHDRVAQGLQPICIQSCPTGALSFGMRTATVGAQTPMTRELENRTAITRQKGIGSVPYGSGEGRSAPLGGLGVVQLLEAEPRKYHNLPQIPKIPGQVNIWRGLWVHLMYILPLAIMIFAFVRQSVFGKLGQRVDSYDEEDYLPTDEELEKQFEAKRRAGKLMHTDLRKGPGMRKRKISKPKRR